MKKNVFLICILLCSLSFFGRESSIIADYKNSLQINFNFNFDLPDVYSGGLFYFIEFQNEKIKVSDIDQVINYIDFSQPGFEITYRYPKEIRSPTFIKTNYEFFSVNADNFLNLSLKELFFGINFSDKLLKSSYWIKFTDIQTSEFNIGIDNNSLGLYLNIGQNGVRPFFNLGKNIFFSVHDFFLDDLYIMTEEVIFRYSKSSGKLLINSLYFNYSNNIFSYRIPINDKLMFVISDLGFGISFILKV
ncbi:MAG TPA: hypothetical protein PKH64_03460 [Petrotogaceae bacterium]|nr:hypothetical protein [Petrotogaceae bacterium]HNV05158.1 hypothetical protein [Petrotogaceae bacterium]HNY36452.1 hypothetical protein [Petrotogaceae bacterium]HOG34446.1 hypothetical protein [Petrotogaceae bacterium]HPG47911.1 hypothetical protein [Petrotogaceae bacterium]